MIAARSCAACSSGVPLGVICAIAARTLESSADLADFGARFGGRLKAMVSGGAPLNPDVGIFFTALGVTILQGVCFYILQNLSPMRQKNGWKNMVSNSAKIVNIIGAHRFNTILRRTADCVEIACSGVLK